MVSNDDNTYLSIYQQPCRVSPDVHGMPVVFSVRPCGLGMDPYNQGPGSSSGLW